MIYDDIRLGCRLSNLQTVQTQEDESCGNVR